MSHAGSQSSSQYDSCDIHGGRVEHPPVYGKGKPLYKRLAPVYTIGMLTAVKILGGIALCYIVMAAWVYSSQRKLLFHPRADLVGTPSEVGLAYEDVWLTTSQGTRVHGWWMPHENARFTILFSHGNGGNISHRLETFRIFHALGLSVMIYDYSGYGRSEGEPSEIATRADGLAAWDWLVQEQNIAPESVIFFGRSLGGAVTARLAADVVKKNYQPAGLILESTFTSVPDMGARMYPWLPVRTLAKYRYDSVTELADIRLPILFGHSSEDDVVPYELGQDLCAGYGGPKSFMEMMGDHNSGYLAMEQAYPEALNRFLVELEQAD